jgi:hypothetical protein
MTESHDLARSFRRNLSGDRVGIHLPLEGATADLNAAQAAAAPSTRFNSIWAITNHLWFWEESLLRLLTGQPADHQSIGMPDGGGWAPPGDPADDAGWLAHRARALDTGLRLADHVEGLDAAGLDADLPAWGGNVRRGIYGILTHNSYHTAEILTVRHMQGWWVENT